VTRPEEIAAIDDYIASHGLTRCEARYSCETSIYLPAGIVAARLAEMQVRPPIEYARLLHHLMTAWRRRMEARRDGTLLVG
jgi:hypothetical protein